MTAERKLLILGLLRMTDMHGYILNDHIGSMSPVTLKKPAAYNLLDSMERDGWIEHREEYTGNRQRKIFSLTVSGEREFFNLLRKNIGSYTPNESPSMVGISFLDVLSAEEALELLRQRRTAILEYRKTFMPESNSQKADPHSGSMYLPIEYARRLADFDLAFIDEVIEDISKRLEKGDNSDD